MCKARNVLSPRHHATTSHADYRSTTLLPGLAGVPVNVTFRTAMTDEQRTWLRATTVSLRSITFCPEEPASHVIMEPVSVPSW